MIAPRNAAWHLLFWSRCSKKINKRSYVFDTNVLVSAVLSKQSTSRKAFDKALIEGEILLSLEVIDELDAVLKREKFGKYLRTEERHQFISKLINQARLVTITVKIIVCRDAKDNKFLELAVSGNAHAIISGDEDLVILHPFRAISIINPAEFVQSTEQNL